MKIVEIEETVEVEEVEEVEVAAVVVAAKAVSVNVHHDTAKKALLVWPTV